MISVIAVLLIALLVFCYAAIGGAVASWADSLYPDAKGGEGSQFFMAVLWPTTAPILFGVQVYRWISGGDQNGQAT